MIDIKSAIYFETLIWSLNRDILKLYWELVKGLVWKNTTVNGSQNVLDNIYDR